MPASDPLYRPIMIPDLLVRGLASRSNDPCVVAKERVLTYADVYKRTSQYLQALQSKGIKQGSRVAILAGNVPETLCNLAALQIGGVCSTPLHPRGSLDDQAFMLTDAGIETLIFDPQFEERAAALKQKVPSLDILLSFGPSAVGEDYDAMADRFSPCELMPPQLEPTDLSTIIYTGGTTGRPKGVMQSFRAAAHMTMIQMTEWEWPSPLRILIVTPLSHAAAALFVPTLLNGGCIYVSESADTDTVLDMIETHRITATLLVPTMIYGLLDSPRSPTVDLSGLQTVFYGAAPIDPGRLREAILRWGPIFFQFYGQAEAPALLANMRRSEHDLSKPGRLGACGRPTVWSHLAILDEEMKVVPSGECGEICVRGPLVMNGYHNRPEETRAALRGGWLHTGDVGYIDGDGFLHIVDRLKDMIITGGFNVFSREVEEVLVSHAAVLSAAVIGVPDPRWGEAVKAFVVLHKHSEAEVVGADELIRWVKDRKGAVHAPKLIEFLNEIPTTPLGKPDKKALRLRA